MDLRAVPELEQLVDGDLVMLVVRRIDRARLQLACTLRHLGHVSSAVNTVEGRKTKHQFD